MRHDHGHATAITTTAISSTNHHCSDKKEMMGQDYMAVPESSSEEEARLRDVQRRLKCATILCLIFLLSEIAGGLISGSLAILSDAAHLFGDFISFLFAVAASKLASLPPTDVYTYGYRRAEVLAALCSMGTLAICSVWLMGEGLRRLYPFVVNWATGSGMEGIEEVNGEVMTAVAFVGVVVNVALALVLGVENHVHMPGDNSHGHGHDHNHGHSHGHGEDHEQEHEEHCDQQGRHDDRDDCHHEHSHVHDDGRGHFHGKKESKESKRPKKNINLHAAYLHVLGDLVQSVAVFVAGIIIKFKPEWRAIDPILTLVFCPLVFYSTTGIIRTSVNILLEGVPSDVRLSDVRSDVEAVDGVSDVTDLRVWSISHGSLAMTVRARAVDPRSARREIRDLCATRHGIDLCTIELEQDLSKESGVLNSDEEFQDDKPSLERCGLGHDHGHSHGHAHGHDHSSEGPADAEDGDGDCELVGLKDVSIV